MSKTISNNLKSHIAGEVTTIAMLWKLTRVDSTVLGFTNYDQDIVYGGVTYEAHSGINPSALSQSSNLSVDNLESELFLESDRISEADLMAGKYDYARLDIYLINYESVADGVLILASGWILGEVSVGKSKFKVEVRSKSQLLQQHIGELYSPDCRADLGDSDCGVNLVTFTVTGSVTTEVSNSKFIDSSRSEANDYLKYGKLTWTSGLNNGFSMEVKTNQLADKSIELVDSMPYNISNGDTYSLYAGCDKSSVICKSKFNNFVNFRGEPFIPGLDETMKWT